MKLNKKTAIIGLSISAVVGIAMYVVFRKKKLGTTTPEQPPIEEDPPTTFEPPYVDDPDPVLLDPVQDPDPEPEPIQVEPPAANPYDPSPEPVKGGYYAVVKDDTMLGICGRAGFSGTEKNQAYRAMLHAVENAWIGSKTDANGWEVLRFNKRFAAVPGYEGEPWAWGTEYVPNTPGKWPVVYVPKDDELSA